MFYLVYMQNNKNPKIFIVEDNADIREIYRLQFQAAGFTVVTSGDGLDFVSRISEEMPDLVLLDLMLPEMDGFSVLKSIKDNFENSKLQQVPIIIWSNLSEDSDITKALEYGANFYLRKSDYEGADLVDKVKDLIGKK